MNLFSQARQNHLSRLIAEDLLSGACVGAVSKESLFSAVRRGFFSFEKEWGEMHEEVSRKIKSIKRGILPGSAEWDSLYERFFEEIFNKKSRLFIRK